LIGCGSPTIFGLTELRARKMFHRRTGHREKETNRYFAAGHSLPSGQIKNGKCMLSAFWHRAAYTLYARQQIRKVLRSIQSEID
jgi:hypothetical protein